MQGARARHVLELAPQLGDALADQAAVDFELAFAGPAEKTEAAALPLEMGPGTHGAASADRTRPPARPAAALHGCGRARRKSRGSGRYGRSPWPASAAPN